MSEIIGETFTQRCRSLLTQQPDQAEFTLSRAGLEVLVLDSERYGEQNARLAAAAAAHKAAYPEPMPLDEQVAEVAEKWPGTELIEPPDANGYRWLRIPGVRLPRGFKPNRTTIWLRVPPALNMGMERFFTDPDVRHDSGGPLSHSSTYEIGGRMLTEHFWKVCSWDWRRDRLRTYALAMLRSFPARQH